jgi:hypothetical protein
MQSLTNYLLQTRDRLDEATARKWSDDQLTRFINEGARDIARKTECLFDTEDVVITAGTAEVVGPTDCVRVYRIQYTRDGESMVYPLEFRDLNAMDGVWWTQQDISQSSSPAYFTLWGYPPTLSIRVYPIPATAGSLKVFYYALPNVLTTDNPSIPLNLPEGWENLVVSFAEYTAMRNDADPRWQEAKGLYEADLTSMLATVTRFSDQSGQFVPDDVTGGAVPWWLLGEVY